MSDALGLGRSNFGPLWQIRVRTKPSKQPLGLVARGVPIEKVRAKRAMHSDWGGPTLVKVMYSWGDSTSDNAIFIGFLVVAKKNFLSLLKFPL